MARADPTHSWAKFVHPCFITALPLPHFTSPHHPSARCPCSRGVFAATNLCMLVKHLDIPILRSVATARNSGTKMATTGVMFWLEGEPTIVQDDYVTSSRLLHEIYHVMRKWCNKVMKCTQADSSSQDC